MDASLTDSPPKIFPRFPDVGSHRPKKKKKEQKAVEGKTGTSFFPTEGEKQRQEQKKLHMPKQRINTFTYVTAEFLQSKARLGCFVTFFF